MRQLSGKFDALFLNLLWSLWTELGVQGTQQHHQQTLIFPEELIVVTAIMMDQDPRLRDESLDWCAQYHQFVATSRLRAIVTQFGDVACAPFSRYAATVNALANAHWPLFADAHPLKIHRAQKSTLRNTSPAVLDIRSRALFGTGARADIVAFFLCQPESHFAASDLGVIGYSKRNLSAILDDFCLSSLFEKFLQRNQWRYRMSKRASLQQILGPIPLSAPLWAVIFHCLVQIRCCVDRIKNMAESSQAIELHTLLLHLQNQLSQLHITVPAMQSDTHMYLASFHKWLLELFAEGGFSRGSCAQ